MKKASVLYIEDDDADADLVKTAVEMEKCAMEINVIDDGEEALRYLSAKSAGANGKPDIILLDLNLPKIDGHEILQTIKGDENLRHIPVIVLSTSNAPADVNRIYSLGANAYMVKPTHFKDYQKILKSICDYWVGTAVLPSIDS